MSVKLGMCVRAAAGGVVVLSAASGVLAQDGFTNVDAKCNIFGYGVGTPQPGGGGGGLVAIVINLTPGTGRTATFNANGTAWWNDSIPGSNGPDGGNFDPSTNISALGPVSSYAAPLTGHLVGLLLEAGDPAALAAPAGIAYPDAASQQQTSYSPGIRQVFFIGDGFTGNGGGTQQTFNIPDSATQLVLGIADAGSFVGAPGWYDDNIGGYTVKYDIVPAPATLVALGMGGLAMARRRAR